MSTEGTIAETGAASPPSSEDIAALDAVLGTTEYHSDPYATLSRIREVAPVYRSKVLDAWLISRFEDVATVLRNGTDFSAKSFGKMVKRTPETREIIELIENNMIGSLDPPDHTRLRRILQNGVFTAERLVHLRATITEIVTHVLDQLESRGHMDVMTDLTQPVAYGFLTRFLGVAPEEGQKFLGWAGTIAQFMLQPNADDAAVKRGVQAFEEVRAYVEDQIEQRVANPTTKDVFGLLVSVRQEEDLSDDEILATAMQMVFAGAGTVSNGVANTIYQLLRHPEQYAALCANPKLINAAFEEGTRCESPVFFTYRITTTDVTLNGTTIPAGETVIVNIGGANRDPDMFDDPERFEIMRKRAPHLGFGFGPHVCFGARIARLQGEIILNELIHRFPNLQLDGENVRWSENFALREMKALPVSW